MNLLEMYNIVPKDEQKLYKQKPGNVASQEKKRELRINQYKREKDLNIRIEVGGLLTNLSVN
jgi:hypothetical protein